MRKIIVSPSTGEFRREWGACLRKAPRSARIATLPELASARAVAPRPHTPGKPWETYRREEDSPLWWNWLMTSSCLLIGELEGRAVIVVVHGLDQGESCEDHRGKFFRFGPEIWSRLSAGAPEFQRLSLGTASYCLSSGRHDGYFTATGMCDNPLFRAIFGPSLDVYADAHRAMASEYLACKLDYNGVLGEKTIRHARLISDPPVIKLGIDWIARTAPPNEGAIGQYLCLENVMNTTVDELRPYGMTRTCDLDSVGPDADARFLISVD